MHLEKRLKTYPGMASPSIHYESHLFTNPRHFGGIIKNLGIWKSIGRREQSPRRFSFPHENIMYVTSELADSALRLDFSNENGNLHTPGEFLFYDKATGEPDTINPYDNGYTNTSSVVWKFRHLFTDREARMLGMSYTVHKFWADEQGNFEIPVGYLFFNYINRKPDIWPNENIAGLSFILIPGQNNELKGEIYPLLLPDSIDHQIVGSYQIHNGQNSLVDHTRLRKFDDKN